jgi:hypothetical protein
LSFHWIFGIDPATYKVTRNTDATMFELYSGEGQVISGGPIWFFKGEIAPCFVCARTKASILSQIFAGMLGFIESVNLFD